MPNRSPVRIPPATFALVGVVAAFTAHCSAPTEEDAASASELVAADAAAPDARPTSPEASTSDAGAKPATDAAADAKTDAKPDARPPDPDPDPDPKPCEECTAEPTHFEPPPFEKSWGQSIDAEWLGPEQTIGWNARVEVAGSRSTDQCACEWSHELSGAVTASAQVGKYGANFNGAYLDAKTTCKTPVCPPGGKHACEEPSGVDEVNEWTLGGGGQIQLPVPGPLMVVCKSKLVQCQIQGRFTISVGKKTEGGSGEGSCAPCDDGKQRQIVTEKLDGEIAGGMEAELTVPWVGNVQVGAELQAGGRYRTKNGTDCGTPVNKVQKCGWVIGRAYATACAWGICIDKEAELGYGFACRDNEL